MFSPEIESFLLRREGSMCATCGMYGFFQGDESLTNFFAPLYWHTAAKSQLSFLFLLKAAWSPHNVATRGWQIITVATQ